MEIRTSGRKKADCIRDTGLTKPTVYNGGKDDFMAKTIKQIADELGISKQAVFKRIDNLGLRSKLTKIDNQLMVEKSKKT